MAEQKSRSAGKRVIRGTSVALSDAVCPYKEALVDKLLSEHQEDRGGIDPANVFWRKKKKRKVKK